MTDAETFDEGDIFAPRATSGVRFWQRRWARWAIIFGCWTVLAFLFTGQLYYTRVLSERPLTWREAASTQFIYPYFWAVGTIIVLGFANRFPVEGTRWWRNLLLHLFFATLFVIFISGAFHIAYHFLFINSPEKPYQPWTTVQWIIFNSTENYGIYGLLLLLNQVFRFYRRFREGELRASQLETQLTQAQLQALKMQLHPHFLFNTLHSISALVHKDPDTADRMIARLGDFLRLTLENSGAQEVSLQKELEFLKCYLEIERIRFQDRLTTSLDIEPRALDAPVPNLILQPIVENALRHGVSQRATPGHVAISAKRHNGSLRIEVRDNGPGLRAISKPNGRSREGLGLSNTRARLAQLYGEAHRFELSNAPEGGLVVTLEIPVIKPATS
ncbi:MAG TPA: histidine kinase [Pyrinomonadaceae bacterium]|nr:histidine kinase [Pyrinomonadaceae bacterium]